MSLVKNRVKGTESLLKSAIRRIALGKMEVNSKVQREMREARVDKLAAEMDLDLLGLPVLSERGGRYYVVDGQHRVEALKKWLGNGWETQQIECRVYEGLSEKQEANLFVKLNDALKVTVFDNFMVSVQAGYPEAVAVKNVVDRTGLRMARNHSPGALTCPGTLLKIMQRADADVLRETLETVRDGLGDGGLEAPIISGVSLVIQRYRSFPNLHERLMGSLSNVRGGASGLVGRAIGLQKQIGNERAACVAAVIVDLMNSGRGGKKLPSWWKSTGTVDAG